MITHAACSNGSSEKPTAGKEPSRPPHELTAWQLCAVFVVALCLIVSRRPDAFFHAQFYAEDGVVFYHDAYEFGWMKVLFHPYGGYFHAVPRLSAALSLLWPFASAPLVLNCVAICVQALPAVLLLSSGSVHWGGPAARTSMAVMFIALPNGGEIHANITNSQCFMALSAFLLIAALPPRRTLSCVIAILFLILFGLSGPYCIFLAPIALFFATQNQSKWRWACFSVLASCAAFELLCLVILDPGGRTRNVLGATVGRLVRILAGDIYLGTLLGPNRMGGSEGSAAMIVLLLLSIGGTFVIAICFCRSSDQMRAFILFSFAVFAASLMHPMSPVDATPLWQRFVSAGGEHYWFFPILSFAWSLLWLFRDRSDLGKVIGGALLCIMSFGIVRDWVHPPFKDLNFHSYAIQFQSSAPGARTTIPINPLGWQMQLIKH
jgi:hypothetical protein